MSDIVTAFFIGFWAGVIALAITLCYLERAND